MQDEGRLVLDGVDRVDDVIVLVQFERGRRGFREAGVDRLDPGFRIDVQEDFLQDVHFRPAHGGNRGHALPVDVGGDHVVRIDDRQVPDAGPDESFRAPAADPAHAEQDDARGREAFHHVGPEQQFGPVEDILGGGDHRASQPSRRSRTSRQTSSLPISFRISWRIPG